MTQKLFITTSTLNRYIQKINNSLKKKIRFPNLEEKTCNLLEMNKTFGSSSFNTLLKRPAFFEWPFDFVDEASLEKILVDLFKSSNFPQSFEGYRVFKMIFTVNFFRSYQGHFVQNFESKDKFYDYYNQLDGLDENRRAISSKKQESWSLQKSWNNPSRFSYNRTSS